MTDNVKNQADKIDILTDKLKKYQDVKLEMFKKSRQAILDQQKADLDFCKDLNDFFNQIKKPR